MEKHVNIICDPDACSGDHTDVCEVAQTDNVEMMEFFVEHFGREQVIGERCDGIGDLLLRIAGYDTCEVINWLVNKMQVNPSVLWRL